MALITNHEITLHLFQCFHESKQMAQNKAYEAYKHLFNEPQCPKTRMAELERLEKLLHSEATVLDRQIYLNHGDDPRFLATYFGSPYHLFSSNELKKYRLALIIHEKQQLLHFLMARIIFSMASDNQGITNPFVFPELGQMSSVMENLQTTMTNEGAETPNNSKCTLVPGRKKSNTFGYLGTVELLGSIADDLTGEIGYLRSPTTTAQFIEVATSKDLASVGITICFGCLNTQLIYVIEYFEALFLSFNAATIGNSMLFYSKKGNLLKGHNINSTSTYHIHQRYAIDAIFKKYNIAKA